MTKRILRSNKGAALFVSIICAALLLSLLMGILTRSAQVSLAFSQSSSPVLEARYAAYAGIERAFEHLDIDPQWMEGWPTRQGLEQNPDYGYTVEFRTSIVGTSLSENELVLYAEGYSPHSDKPVALAALNCTAIRPPGLFHEAGFGLENMTISQSSIVNGHVGSNRLVLVDDSTIHGNVILPDPAAFAIDGISYSGAPEISLVGSGNYTGQEERPTKPRELPEIVVPGIANGAYQEITEWDQLANGGVGEPPPTLLPGGYKSLKLSGERTLRLVPGKYYFESFEIDGPDLVIDRDRHGGTVRLFIGESLKVKNSTLNTLPGHDDDDDPVDPQSRWLQILFTDELKGTEGDARGHSVCEIVKSEANGVFVGRYLRAKLTESEIFGAISGDRLSVRNSTLGYDDNVSDVSVAHLARWKQRNIIEISPGSI